MSDKILIVDDEVEIADLIETYLKNEDYAVYKFYSAKDALACIDETELPMISISGFRKTAINMALSFATRAARPILPVRPKKYGTTGMLA